MNKNVAGQNVTIYAWDVTTGLPKTGDQANIAVCVQLNDGTATALANTTVNQANATIAPGIYYNALAQSETNADKLTFGAKSSTANVTCIVCPNPVVYTQPINASALSIDSSGRIDIGKALGTAVTLDANNVLNVSTKYVGGTLQTARDIGGAVPAATAGATGGLLIAGSNAATTFATLTVAGAFSCGNTTLSNFTVSNYTNFSKGVTITSDATNPALSIIGAGTGDTVLISSLGNGADTLAIFNVGTNGSFCINVDNTAGQALNLSNDGGPTAVQIFGDGSAPALVISDVTSVDSAKSVVNSYVSGQSPASLILATPANKLATDSSGRTLLQPTQTGVTIPAVTTVATTTNLTNLPAIPTNWITAAGIAANALNGKGDWLTTLGTNAPANWLNAAAFAASSLNGKGDWVTTLGTNAPVGWLNAAAFTAASLNGKGDWNTTTPPTTAAIAGAILSNTTNKLLTDVNGFVTFNNANIAVAGNVTLNANQTLALQGLLTMTNNPSLSNASFTTAALANAPAGGGGGNGTVINTNMEVITTSVK